VSKKNNSFWRRIFSPKTLAGLAISALGLFLGFRKFNGVEFIDSIRQTNLWVFGLSMAVMLFMMLMRGWRWKYLIYPIRNLPVRYMFEMEVIGFFGNNVFPFRLGEFLRGYALAKNQKMPVVTILGTIVIERTLDSLTFLVLMVGGAIAFPGMPEWVHTGGIISAVVILIFGILVYISQLKRETLKGFVKRKINMSTDNKIGKVIYSFWQGLTSLKNTPHLGLIIFQSLTIWAICIGNFWIMGVSLGVNFNLYSLLLIFFVTSAIVSVPSAPGYVGTYHAATIGILVFLGLELSLAQALAVIMHAVGFISLTAFGLVFFLKYQINVRDTAELYAEKGD